MSPTTATQTPTWIVGSSGLLAGELARLIEGHDQLQLRAAVSREGGKALREMHPHLSTKVTTITLDEAIAQLDGFLTAPSADDAPQAALFLGLPHGHSASAWKRVAEALGPKAEALAVVDLSADFRLGDPQLFEQHYAMDHPDPSGEQGFVYGLPEFWRGRVRESRRVAAPGCFATALQLAVLPAASADQLSVESPWILNAVTGSSGSGIAPKAGTHHPFRHGSYKAYSPGGHRHEAELEQALSHWKIQAPLHFLPHSGPWSRGIHLTANLPLATDSTAKELHELYAARYADEPFVEVLPPGGIPELRAVVGSNRACLGIFERGGVLTVFLALDNTIKGGSGQALQCMNLMLGLPETSGLSRAGLGY